MCVDERMSQYGILLLVREAENNVFGLLRAQATSGAPRRPLFPQRAKQAARQQAAEEEEGMGELHARLDAVKM